LPLMTTSLIVNGSLETICTPAARACATPADDVALALLPVKRVLVIVASTLISAQPESTSARPLTPPVVTARDDLLLQPTQAPGTLGHQRRGERSVPVPRLIQADLPDLGGDRLRARPVAGVPRPTTGRVTLVIAQVVGQLHLHPALQHRLDQLGQEPARPRQRQTAVLDPAQ